MKILRINCVWSGFLSLVLSLHAQTFTTVHAFVFTDGSEPNALIQGSDGLLYGTSGAGLGGIEGSGLRHRVCGRTYQSGKSEA
jgi:hypothetical protein